MPGDYKLTFDPDAVADSTGLEPKPRRKLQWSPQQAAVFDWFRKGSGNLLVRARAGTGKTTTVIEGINHAPESRILLAAFNKRIADELKERLDNPAAEARTLHSLGLTFITPAWRGVKIDSEGARLRQHVTQVCGEGPGDPDRAALHDEGVMLVKRLATCIKEMLPDSTDAGKLRELQLEQECDPETDALRANGYTSEWVVESALKVLTLARKEDGMVDFSDMLYVPLACNLTHGRYDLVVIDEAQDMNYAQLLLAMQSCKPGGRICIVGDDRQAVYAFRGAAPGCLDMLQARLHAPELPLTITYRCPQAVVKAAQRLVPDYTCPATAPPGLVGDVSEKALVNLLGPGDVVLSRLNAPLVGLCLKCLRVGKRARVEGRDIGRGITRLVERLQKHSGERLDVFLGLLNQWEAHETQKWVKAGKPRKVVEITDRAEVVSTLAADVRTVSDLLGYIKTLFADTLGHSGADKQIVFSTVHKAKGLEFPRVYLLRWTFKMQREGMDPTEEANIQYVAITRSRSELFWVKSALQMED